MPQIPEELAREFERKAEEAEASKPTGGFVAIPERYREHRAIEARVWREAAKLVRETAMQ